VADLPIGEKGLGGLAMGLGGKGGVHRPPPSVFEEPAGSDLLDSFGF